eukprot:2390882-Rhodomonas_salina.2
MRGSVRHTALQLTPQFNSLHSCLRAHTSLSTPSCLTANCQPSLRQRVPVSVSNANSESPAVRYEGYCANRYWALIWHLAKSNTIPQRCGTRGTARAGIGH